MTAVYAAEIEEARSRANDFQLAILEDGVISNAEMLEMQHRFTNCMDEQGFAVWFDDLNGGYTFSQALENSADLAVEIECHKETLGSIESLYLAMRENPKNENYSEIYARCLVNAGVAPTGFTGNDLDKLYGPGLSVDQYLQSAETIVDVDGEPALVLMGPDYQSPEEKIIPGGNSLDSPEATECFMNPQR